MRVNQIYNPKLSSPLWMCPKALRSADFQRVGTLFSIALPWSPVYTQRAILLHAKLVSCLGREKPRGGI
jgi:hypothetical protein